MYIYMHLRSICGDIEIFVSGFAGFDFSVNFRGLWLYRFLSLYGDIFYRSMRSTFFS